MKTKPSTSFRPPNPLLPKSPDIPRYRAERPARRPRVTKIQLQRAAVAAILLLFLLGLFARP